MKAITLSMLTFAAVAFGVTSVPDVDPVQHLLDIIKNWSTWSPIVQASAVITLIVQMVKKFFPGFKYTQAIVVIGGVVYGVLDAMLSGRSLVDSLIFILITSGGAIILYEVFKTQLNAVFKV